jgi:hypothetical protein
MFSFVPRTFPIINRIMEHDARQRIPREWNHGFVHVSLHVYSMVRLDTVYSGGDRGNKCHVTFTTIALG